MSSWSSRRCRPGRRGSWARERERPGRPRRLQPAALPEPAGHGAPRGRPGGAGGGPGAQLIDHLPRALAGAKAGLGLAAQRGPGVGAGPGPGRARGQGGPVGIEGARAGGGEAARRRPGAQQAGAEVAPGPPGLEGGAAVGGAEPHRDLGAQVQLGPPALARAHADQAGRGRSPAAPPCRGSWPWPEPPRPRRTDQRPGRPSLAQARAGRRPELAEGPSANWHVARAARRPSVNQPRPHLPGQLANARSANWPTRDRPAGLRPEDFPPWRVRPWWGEPAALAVEPPGRALGVGAALGRRPSGSGRSTLDRVEADPPDQVTPPVCDLAPAGPAGSGGPLPSHRSRQQVDPDSGEREARMDARRNAGEGRGSRSSAVRVGPSHQGGATVRADPHCGGRCQ